MSAQKRPADQYRWFSPGEHDLRLERGGDVLWVPAVERGEHLRGGPGLWDVAGVLMTAIRGRVAWKVGVVRFSHERLSRGAVIHRELLERGADPTERIARLVADVRAGRFD